MAELKAALCPHCGTHNNFYADRALAAVCGRCERKVFERRALAVLPDDILRHSTPDEPPPGKIPVLLICFGRVPGSMVSIDVHRYAQRFEPQVRVLTIDPLEHDAFATRYAVRAIPTGILLRGGREVDRTTGAPSERRDPIARMLQRQGFLPPLFGDAPTTQA